MVKRTILASLFFILLTGIFGTLNTKAEAKAAGEGCTAGDDNWPGMCTLQIDCNERNGNIIWVLSACTTGESGVIGCCAVKPGTQESLKPGLGETCSTSPPHNWPGTCTLNADCNNQINPFIAFDVTTCKAGGCCGTNPEAITNITCATAGGWPGTCMLMPMCDWEAKGIVFDNTVEPCKSLPLVNAEYHFGCCGKESSLIIVNTKVCEFAGSNQQVCTDCMGDGEHSWTALGCISTKPEEFITQLLKIGVGIAGGIAFLLILFGGFQILMSAGNPERLNAGKELVTSAITGLLIIIFSLFILRLIGFTIFAIPGFG